MTMEINIQLPERSPNAHKGECGKVAIIAGSVSMIGAAILAAKGALKSGAGLVHLVTVSGAAPWVNIVHPEIIVHSIPDSQVLSENSVGPIVELIDRISPNTLAIGPGLGRADQTQKMIVRVLSTIGQKIPTVVDADALFAIQTIEWGSVATQNWVLTPHAKEFERLFQIRSGQNRATLAKLASGICKQIVVLKGSGTGVSDGNQEFTNSTGNAGMATAGAGDVLTGIISALIAQQLPLYDAACSGVYLHGLAGDFAKKNKGEYSLTATDIIDFLPQAFLSKISENAS